MTMCVHTLGSSSYRCFKPLWYHLSFSFIFSISFHILWRARILSRSSLAACHQTSTSQSWMPYSQDWASGQKRCWCQSARRASLPMHSPHGGLSKKQTWQWRHWIGWFLIRFDKPNLGTHMGLNIMGTCISSSDTTIVSFPFLWTLGYYWTAGSL